MSGISEEPLVRPRPIIICNRCRRPFDCKRETRLPHYDATRCKSCGEKHEVSEAIFERKRAQASDVMPSTFTDEDYANQLYIISAPDDMVKVGVTSNMENRFRTITTDSPVDLTIERTFELEKPRVVESELHEKLSDVQTHGEWFALEDRTVNSFISAVSAVVEKHRQSD